MKSQQLLSLMLFGIISMSITVNTSNSFMKAKTTCHPQCSWKCDDPHCPAICDPVCEPPKCHTSCAEPKNAICDVKCEKPSCEIKCPDKGCEMFDCPKCVTVCKQPHCVTHCQAPKPECEAVCEEPKCDWKCHKPNCPKPKCELVCENPNCTPKVECCPCANGALPLPATPFPFFKQTESNPNCCGCAKPLTKIENYEAWTKNDRTIRDYGTHVVETNIKARTDTFIHPRQIGDSYYNKPTNLINQFEQTVPNVTI